MIYENMFDMTFTTPVYGVVRALVMPGTPGRSWNLA